MTAIIDEKAHSATPNSGAPREARLLTIDVGGQTFGVPALRVRDVLGPQRITRVPLAPVEVAGALNLRGRALTAIDLRPCLGLPSREREELPMNVVVDVGGEHYALLVDRVGEVLILSTADFEPSPKTLDVRWREVSTAVCRLDGRLLVLLDIDRLLRLDHSEAA